MSGKQYQQILLFVTVLWLSGACLSLAGPYYDATTGGIAYDDPVILGWATGCTGWRPSYATFGDFSDAVGAAPGVTNDVVSLGDGGYAILSFDAHISDGPGPDLAVFENALAVGSDVFAELGFVEVSSDGINFVRFGGYSLTGNPVDTFAVIDPTDIHNLAGKHINNEGTWLGTPFDLADLADEDAVQSGLVALSHITHVKIIDVVGDGSTFDGQGNPIYDPYPTDFSSGGFDLDAVAVLNTSPEPATLLGDANGDSVVSADDFASVQANFRNSGTPGIPGDANHDGLVSADDFASVQQNFGNHLPEPATLGLLLVGGLAVLKHRR